MALLVLRSVGFVCRGKAKCATCGLAKIVLKNVRWKKNKKHRGGNECRLTRCPFVVLFLCLWSPVKMVYFFCFSVRYFLSGGCLLRLHTTVLSYTQAGILTTELPTKNRTPNLSLSCPTKHETPACV